MQMSTGINVGVASSSIHEVRIQTLGELIDVASKQPALRGKPLVFRGMQDAEWHLETSVTRHAKGADRWGILDLEHALLRDFDLRARAFVPQALGPWEARVLAQHYGVPTRLLDWTFSVVVAAHFATLPLAKQPGRGCAIWSLDWSTMQQVFGLSETPWTVRNLEDPEIDIEFKPSSGAFLDYEIAEEDSAFLLEPAAVDSRVVAQMGVFTMCSDVEKSLDLFLVERNHQDLLTKYVIYNDDVPTIRRQLDECGIAERRLFPDLGGVARELARTHPPIWARRPT